MKRLRDLVIASLFLALTLPLMLTIALVIKLESTGPVLERRECIGRGGRRFQMLKFRTAMHDPRHTGLGAADHPDWSISPVHPD